MQPGDSEITLVWPVTNAFALVIVIYVYSATKHMQLIPIFIKPLKPYSSMTNTTATFLFTSKALSYYCSDSNYKAKTVFRQSLVYDGNVYILVMRRLYIEKAPGASIGGPIDPESFFHCMMTSSNGNIFRVTGHLCDTKASDAELCSLLSSAPE